MTPDRSDLNQDSDLHLMEVLKLLQHLVAPRRSASDQVTRADIQAELSEDLRAFCQVLELERAVIFEALYDNYFEGLRLSQLASCDRDEKKGSAEDAARVRAGLPIASKSEVFSLLHEGSFVPLGQAVPSAGSSTPHAMRELAEFLGLRPQSSAVLFPLGAALPPPSASASSSQIPNRVRGLVLMERDSKAGAFSENLLDLGAVISQMLEPKLLRLSAGGSQDDSLAIVEEAFERTVLPVVVVNRKTLTIQRINEAAAKFFAGADKEAGLPDGSDDAPIIGRRLNALFPGASHFIEVLERACAKNSGPSCFSVAAKDLGHTGCAFALVSFVGDGGNHVWVQLIPENFLPDSTAKNSTAKSLSSRPNKATGAAAGKNGGTAGDGGEDGDEEALLELSRRLNFERWLRQTICKLHSSLDRDHVLQTLADSLGRAFRATRCLVIRTDGPSHPMVTHEYVEPDLSPLGLGRTGQFPMFAISLFTQKTISYGDVSQIKNSGPLMPVEVDQLLENSIFSMAGAPLSYQGQPFGVLILVDGSRPRKWSEEELETIELTASQASVALSHSQTYHQAKDQLFHMNLLGNLTQQLTNALEVATKAPTKGSGQNAQDKNQVDGNVTPLSSRELEVLRLIASGYANREIAQRLFLTESTVELHASRIRKKLHLKSRTALVKYACDNSLV